MLWTLSSSFSPTSVFYSSNTVLSMGQCLWDMHRLSLSREAHRLSLSTKAHKLLPYLLFLFFVQTVYTEGGTQQAHGGFTRLFQLSRAYPVSLDITFKQKYRRHEFPRFGEFNQLFLLLGPWPFHYFLRIVNKPLDRHLSHPSQNFLGF